MRSDIPCRIAAPARWDSQSLRRWARHALRDQIRRLETGSARWKIPFVHERFEPAEDSHFHLYPEMLVQAEGRSIMRFPRETLSIGPGETLVVPGGLPHDRTNAPKTRACLYAVFAYSDKYARLLVRSETADGSSPLQDVRETLVGPGCENPGRYLNDIAELSKRSRRPHVRTAIRCLLTAHFAQLLEWLSAPAPPNDPALSVVRHCRELLNRRLCDPSLSVNSLARWIGCSPDYLSHRFHEETGMRLLRHIHAQRIRHAQTLLNKTAMNISEIAYACGYRHPGHFASLFRKMAGTSPGAWRERRRAAGIATYDETMPS